MKAFCEWGRLLSYFGMDTEDSEVKIFRFCIRLN